MTVESYGPYKLEILLENQQISNRPHHKPHTIIHIFFSKNLKKLSWIKVFRVNPKAELLLLPPLLIIICNNKLSSCFTWDWHNTNSNNYFGCWADVLQFAPGTKSCAAILSMLFIINVHWTAFFFAYLNSRSLLCKLFRVFIILSFSCKQQRCAKALASATKLHEQIYKMLNYYY